MFDIGWTEMLVIAVVMIVVVGPKDLPKMLRTFGRTTAKLRTMAGDFQRQFNEALKEAELDDVKKSVDSLKSLNPANEIKKQLNPFEKAAADVRSGLDSVKPKPPTPASPAAQAAEPLKAGATATPSEAPQATVSASPATDTDTAPAIGKVASEPAPAPKTRKARTAKPAATAAQKTAVKPKTEKAAKPKSEKTAKPKPAPRRKKTEGNAP